MHRGIGDDIGFNALAGYRDLAGYRGLEDAGIDTFAVEFDQSLLCAIDGNDLHEGLCWTPDDQIYLARRRPAGSR